MLMLRKSMSYDKAIAVWAIEANKAGRWYRTFIFDTSIMARN